MTENEAKKNIIAYASIEAENLPVGMGIAFDTAIKALEEVEQYRQIGTVEKCLRNKDFLDFLSDKINPNDFETYLSMYNSSGEKAGEGDGN